MLKLRTTLLLTLAALATLAWTIAPGPLLPEASASALSHNHADTVDRVILRSGKIIEGKILSETDTKIQIMVTVGAISAPTWYQKSDVLSIERDVESSTKATTRPATRRSDSPKRASSETPDSTNNASPTAKRIYIMNLKGNLGYEITKTPLQRAFDDALKNDPDVIVVKMDAGSGIPGQDSGFDGLFTAEDLAPIAEKLIDDGHRIVFWVKRATSGAAFLPLISPEIYFTSDGKLGGVGDLTDFDIGDEMVNKKQISLRIGHAEGFAITGGYEPKLIRAMALKDEWLAVRFRGGEPQYITWEPRPEDGEGWTILTDNGKGKNKDQFSFEGNDTLTLDADWAYRLHIARGVVDTMDDLAFEMNIGRNYTVIHGKADKILSDWRESINRALDQLRRLQKDLAEQTRGRNQTAAIGRQINKLKQMRGILSAYAEVYDPDGSQRAKIDVQIEELREQIRKANRRRR